MTTILEGFERFPYNGTVETYDIDQRQMSPLGLLLASGGAVPSVVNAEMGYSVSISADGSTMIVGSHRDSGTVEFAGAAYVFTLSAGKWVLQAKLTASNPVVGAYFGIAVAISADGSTAVIGESRRFNYESSAGAAYVFTRSGDTWTQQAQLFASEPKSTAYFGESVAINADGSTIVIGAYQETNPVSAAGAVYVFPRTGSSWGQPVRLTVESPRPSEYFGKSVAISYDGTVLVVGASNARFNTINGAGQVHIFQRFGESWTRLASRYASDPSGSANFGWSVAISGDASTIAVGACRKTITGANQAGVVYIIARSGENWTEQAKLFASPSKSYAQFGWSVAVNGDGATLIVGARTDPTQGSNAGAAYVFTRSGGSWSQNSRIIPAGIGTNAYLGCAVSLDGVGSTAVIGSHGDSVIGTYAGAAYVVERGDPGDWTQWFLKQKLYPGGFAANVTCGSVKIKHSTVSSHGRALSFEKMGATTGGGVMGQITKEMGGSGSASIVGFKLKVVSVSHATTIVAPSNDTSLFPTQGRPMAIAVFPTSPHLSFNGVNVPAGKFSLGDAYSIEIVTDHNSGVSRLYINGEFALEQVAENIGRTFLTFSADQAAQSVEYELDDFYCQWSDNVVELEPMGTFNVDLFQPSGSDLTEFTPHPNTMTNHEIVNTLPVTDTSYVSAEQAGAKDVHNFHTSPSLTPDGNVIIAIQTTVIAHSLGQARNATATVTLDGLSNTESVAIASDQTAVIRATISPTAVGDLTGADLVRLKAGYGLNA